MGYRSTRECVDDLERHGQLVRVAAVVEPRLEMAEIQRRLYERNGPAVLFERVAGSPFPAVCNLFGSLERARFIFRDTLASVREAIALKANPTSVLQAPFTHWRAPFTALRALPRVVSRGPVLAKETKVSALPAIVSWPDDGGPFITLPQVYTEDPDLPGAMHSNLGMYRVQLGGNDYISDEEVGLHYQIHRGIGVHHAAAGRLRQPLRVSVFVGGPPAHTFAAVMPLPEGISELVFAGMLAGRRVRLANVGGHKVAVDADFCLVGTIDPARTKPEGPFGDHLGYYSRAHDFPVMRVERVFHRVDAIWPFTVVGRPPQEDTTFGKLIHELTGPMVPVSIPGLHAMHAVDAAGVHPLLLALGSERYVPYRPTRPQELLTIANAILGFGQASLAKYLFIAAKGDDAELDVEDIPSFLAHVLRRIDLRRDLHFHTKTTIDTLDYSGDALNEGSKVVVAAHGPTLRTLCTELPDLEFPSGYEDPRLVLPGVVVLRAPPHVRAPDLAPLLDALASLPSTTFETLPLLVVVDDAEFTARTLRNFLWVTFTRSNPARDISGVRESTIDKHWGCEGPLVIDARIKAHHAPPLVEDPEVTRRVDAMAAPGGPLHGVL